MIDNQEELKKALVDILKNGSTNMIKNKSKKLLLDSDLTDKAKLQDMLLNLLQSNN